ncbi:ABC-2 type transport system permease protein [Glaciihabitans tibetensis]|uniref:Transport permease protein n=2 Tax=Glaciihabitans tibetensis TaxID=1266600 RepID=A0A2T0VFC7_9MICO|nr:ABC-2 type transport system permease protein [Glaciihabitans tibetensis]
MTVTTSYSNTLESTRASLAHIFQQREMLALLVRRDIKARYKDSALGLVWALIRPLTQLMIYYIVIGKFLGAERGIPDFAIYVFTGLTAYGLFQEIVGGGTASIVGNSGLIKKIYLPREVFPLASVGSALFNFCIQLGILLIATIVVGSVPWSLDLFYFIPSVIILVVFGTAFGLLLGAANVYLRDIQYLVEVGLLLMLWASPIVYSWEMVRGIVGHGLLLTIYTDNPITLAVLGFQRAFWTAGHDTVAYPEFLLVRMCIAIVVGVIMLFAFQRVFAKLQGNFAQQL